MSENEEPVEPEEKNRNPMAAFLPIGISFFAIGIAFFSSEDTRSIAVTFLPVGLVFVFLALSGAAKKRQEEDASGEGESTDEDGAPDSERE